MIKLVNDGTGERNLNSTVSVKKIMVIKNKKQDGEQDDDEEELFEE